MKRLLPLFLAVLILLVSVPVSARADAAAPNTSAQAAILIHADTGQVLYAHNADERLGIASVTKIMTAYVVLQNCKPDEKVQITREDVNVEGSSMYLKSGETYTVEQLLYGLMLASGNDAAMALARHCAGSVPAFADLMNAEAARLGMTDSHFENPHGLDAKGHYSSARDLGILTAAAMQNADFEKIVSTRSITIQNQTYVNHNRLLSSCEGCLGVKTGYTTSAGRSLVSCVERDGLELICVTLNDPDDWDDHMALYNWGFANFSCGVAVPAGEFMRIPVISGAAGDVGVAPEEEAAFLLQRDQALTLRVNLPRFVFAPIEEGSVAGNVEVYVAGELVGTVPLYYGVSVEKQKVLNFSPLERFQQIFALARANGARIAVLEGC